MKRYVNGKVKASRCEVVQGSPYRATDILRESEHSRVVVAPVVRTQGCLVDGWGSGRRDEGGPDLVGGAVAVALEQPRGVVGALEVEQREPQLLHVLEGPDPQELLLQGPEEALGDAVALGRAHVAGARLCPSEAQLVRVPSAGTRGGRFFVSTTLLTEAVRVGCHRVVEALYRS